MKPIHKNLKGYIPKMGFEILGKNLLELVMNLLEIPQKGLPKDRLYTDVNHSFRDPKPLQPASMGVGYKDKGSMGDGFPASLDEVIYESLGFDPSDFLASWLRIQSYFQKQD